LEKKFGFNARGLILMNANGEKYAAATFILVAKNLFEDGE